MALKDWKKIDDDYVQRIYKSNKGTTLIIGKKLTGRSPSVTVKTKSGSSINKGSFYNIKGATKFAKDYRKKH